MSERLSGSLPYCGKDWVQLRVCEGEEWEMAIWLEWNISRGRRDEFVKMGLGTYKVYISMCSGGFAHLEICFLGKGTAAVAEEGEDCALVGLDS